MTSSILTAVKVSYKSPKVRVFIYKWSRKRRPTLVCWWHATNQSWATFSAPTTTRWRASAMLANVSFCVLKWLMSEFKDSTLTESSTSAAAILFSKIRPWHWSLMAYARRLHRVKPKVRHHVGKAWISCKLWAIFWKLWFAWGEPSRLKISLNVRGARLIYQSKYNMRLQICLVSRWR